MSKYRPIAESLVPETDLSGEGAQIRNLDICRIEEALIRVERDTWAEAVDMLAKHAKKDSIDPPPSLL